MAMGGLSAVMLLSGEFFLHEKPIKSTNKIIIKQRCQFIVMRFLAALGVLVTVAEDVSLISIKEYFNDVSKQKLSIDFPSNKEMTLMQEPDGFLEEIKG
jgi:hypothetical protein